MNEVYSKYSINWLKYGNYTNNTNIYEEITILRKWMEIKIDLIKNRNITILHNYYIIKIIYFIKKLYTFLST